MTATDVHELQVRRLLAAIHPAVHERLLIRVVSWCYTHPEGSRLDRLGDHLDLIVCRSYRTRARVGMARRRILTRRTRT